MKFNWRSRRLKVAVVVFASCAASFGLAQNRGSGKPREAHGQDYSPVDGKDHAYCQQFLDKDGGYKDRKGGYYNPKAGTYTDATGGVVDNWAGYTYTDGSYKSKLGDYYDAKENVFKLSDGQVGKAEAGSTPAHNRQLLRDNVQQNDGYDKNFTLNSMIQAIKNEHPKPR